MFLYTLFVRSPQKVSGNTAYETNVEHGTWSFCYNLFWNYADNTHRPTAKNDFRIQGTLIDQNFLLGNLATKQYFLHHTGQESAKNI